MAVKRAERIAFLGGGNMAEALIRGLRASGIAGKALSVSEPRAARRRTLKNTYGVRTYPSNPAAIAGAGIVVLAVKPQTMGDVLAEVRGSVSTSQIVVSIAAGVSSRSIEKGIGGSTRVVRVMPNTPCLLGEGMSVLVAGRKASRGDVSRARKLFDTVGKTDVVTDEALLDAVTGLSGSGPAYVYRFAEALIEGGVRAGLPHELAEKLTFQTLVGASKMLTETGKSPRELREAVSSPGGTTLAGLARMDEGRFVTTIRDAVRAATVRSRQLAKLARHSR